MYRKWITPVILACLSCFLHWRTLYGGFVWDDRAAIVTNADIRSSTPWLDILKHDFWGQNISLPTSHKSYRPLATASLRLNRVLAALYDSSITDVGGIAGLGTPFSYHLTNVLLHALVCALMLVLYRKLFHGQEKPAVLSAVLFTVHPVHVEPVAALVGRADLLSGLFYVLALLCVSNTLQSTHQKRYHATSMICAVAAAASKETGITVLGVMCAWECINVFEQCLSAPAMKQELFHGTVHWLAKAKVAYQNCIHSHKSGCVKRASVRILSSLVLAAVIVYGHISMHKGSGLRQWNILENEIAIIQEREWRILSYAYTHWRYFMMLIMPINLSYDWGYKCIPLITDYTTENWIAPLILYILIIELIIDSLYSHNEVILKTLALIIISFIPVSQLFFPIGTILAERLLYIPSIGFGALIGCILYNNNYNQIEIDDNNKSQQSHSDAQTDTGEIKDTKVKRNPVKQHDTSMYTHKFKDIAHKPLSMMKSMITFWFVISIWIVLFGYKSYNRCHDWMNEFTLFTSALTICPNSIKTLNNLASSMLVPDKAVQAGTLLDKAIELHPTFGAAVYNRALVYTLLKDDYNAELTFKQAIILYPDEPKVLLYLARIKINQAKETHDDSIRLPLTNEASDLIDKCIYMGGVLPLVSLIKAHVLIAQNNHKDAIYYYAKAIDDNDRYIKEHAQSGDLIDSASTWNELCLTVKISLGNHEAIRCYEAAVKQYPDHGILHANYAATLETVGQYDKAMIVYNIALKLMPDSAILMSNYGWLLEQQGDLLIAKLHYEKALQLLAPDTHVQIQTNLDNVIARIHNTASTRA